MEIFKSLFLGSAFLGCLLTAQAEVRLASLFTDGAVLQREMKVPVWGAAAPGETVKVSFAGQMKSTQAGPDGKWMLKLDPLKANAEAAQMTVSGTNEIILKDIVVGEVWLCSGQSNMAWRMENSRSLYEDEIAKSANPLFRTFNVSNSMVNLDAQEFLPEAKAWRAGAYLNKWFQANPQSVLEFSAVAYFFGKELFKSLKVPVGLINSSYGGTPAQAWVPLELLKANPDFKCHVDVFERIRELSKTFADPGVKPEAVGWGTAGLDVAEWEKVKVPSGWFAKENMAGAVWFRREMELPENWAGRKLKFTPFSWYPFTMYFNGVESGSEISGALVKAGRNSMALRLFAKDALPPVAGNARCSLSLVEDPGQSIDLVGEWRRKTENVLASFPPLPNENAYNNLATPSVFYNGRIAPLRPYAIRGAIWYQGESNAGRAYEYRKLFPALVKCWREEWREGDFPFYFVQLANNGSIDKAPSDNAWAELREAQFMALSMPNSGMAVTIDIGGGIHPLNKLDVGRRLSLLARAKTYGERLEFSGPLFKEARVEGSAMNLRFDHVGSGLESSDGGPLKGFAICGADGKFVWAEAKISGEQVEVFSPEVKAPVAVRYAWGANPACNLRNKEGLPASPFRTDKSPGITEPKTVAK